MAETNLILAIESAIAGGSLALSDGLTIIDTWTGNGALSRAEELLENIDTMLQRSNLEKGAISHIAVSAGPGSFTGIRIGLATGMGLATALNIELSRFSILQVMASYAPDGESVVTAVPVGRGVYCMQIFRKNLSEIAAINHPVAFNENEFENFTSDKNIRAIVPDTIPVALAARLATASRDPRLSKINEPLFISKPASI